MNKKGISGHIDWIIGIGLFLVFLGVMLSFFRPGIRDVFEPDTLLDIVEDNFMEESSWQIVKQPVFIEKIEYATANEMTQIGTDVYIALSGKYENGNIDGNFPLVSRDNNKVEIFYIPTSVKPEAPGERRGMRNDDDERGRGEINRRVRAKSRQHSIPFRITNSRPQFFVEWDGSRSYLIISSDMAINPDPVNLMQAIAENDDLPQMEDHQGGVGGNSGYVACRDTPDGDNNNNVCHASYRLGASETLKGLHIDLIDDFDDYNDLKSRWDFPETKDFKIRVYTGENIEESEITEINSGEPPLETNVYSRTFNTQILNDDALLVPVTVNLLIW